MIGKLALANKFKNNLYAKDLREYIRENVLNETLNYDNLKYIYDNLYKNQSQFLRQNIYPVCEFLKKGYSFSECESLANLLPDAKNLTVFCYDKDDVGKIYNKLFYDLTFVYENYDKYISLGNDIETSLSKIKHLLEITNYKERMLEGYISNERFLTHTEKEDYLKYLKNEIIKTKKEIKNPVNSELDEYKMIARYNRLRQTLKKYNNYIKNKKENCFER